MSLRKLGERPGAGPHWELEEQVTLSDEAARKIIVYPLPKNTDPERGAGRRAARAAALACQHQRDEGAVYVDAARNGAGLYIDGCLENGRTEHCDTFGNSSLASSKDFVVRIVEVITFSRLLTRRRTLP
ncbi:hypothetical protein MRX96_007401 [Rhipicephalus microplus]